MNCLYRLPSRTAYTDHRVTEKEIASQSLPLAVTSTAPLRGKFNNRVEYLIRGVVAVCPIEHEGRHDGPAAGEDEGE